MSQKFLRDFVLLIATINPIEALCVFIAVTEGASQAALRRIALRGVLYAAAVLMSFVVLGQIVLDLMEVSLASFQIAGGIVLFIFGLKMIFEHGGPLASGGAESGHDVAIFPLAVPTIACPGSICAVVFVKFCNLAKRLLWLVRPHLINLVHGAYSFKGHPGFRSPAGGPPSVHRHSPSPSRVEPGSMAARPGAQRLHH